jgi:drug/metabolite transporter (DMT)-like permease
VKRVRVKSHISFVYAILSSVLFSLNIPINKWFLNESISPIYLSSFLYLGVGVGMIFTYYGRRAKEPYEQIPRKDIYWFAIMGLLDIVAPILFFSGVFLLMGSTSGLYANVELFFTLIFAFLLFKERISLLATISIGFMLVSFVLLRLSNQPQTGTFGAGEWLIVIASVLWGLENNVSRRLSTGNPHILLIVKGLTTGIGTFLIAVLIQASFPHWLMVIMMLLVGYIVYGISLNYYVLAQRHLGAAKTQTIQSFSFLLGSLLALLIFQESITMSFVVSFILVLIALLVLGYDTYTKKA